jgi:hypothetical protein
MGSKRISRRVAAFVVVAVGVLALAGAAAQGPAGSATPVAGPSPNRITSAAPDPVQLIALDPPAPHGSSAGPTAAIPSTPVSTPAAPSPADTAPAASALTADGIPSVAFAAFTGAVAREQSVDPACGITWPLLAAIGRVESDDGRFAGAVLHTDGTSTPKIIGIPLDGVGTAAVPDTDHGRLDGDPVWDRAVGPMQFIPSTWAAYGVDGNGDHVADPFNIFDAAAAAASYLCTAGGDLSTAAGQQRAVLAYNHSAAYLALVMSLAASYAADAGLPIIETTSPPPTTLPTLPPVNPGRPPALSPGAGATATGHPGPSVSPGSSAPATTSHGSTPSGSTSPPTSTPPSSPDCSTSASPTPSTSGSTTPPVSPSPSDSGAGSSTDPAPNSSPDQSSPAPSSDSASGSPSDSQSGSGSASPTDSGQPPSC